MGWVRLYEYFFTIDYVGYLKHYFRYTIKFIWSFTLGSYFVIWIYYYLCSGELLFFLLYCFFFWEKVSKGDSLLMPPYHFSLLFILPTCSHITSLLLYIFYSLCMGKFALSICIAFLHLFYITFVSLLIWCFYLICMLF